MASYARSRKSPRIPDRDYAAPDCYMVTITTHRRDRVFGDVVDGQMQLSDFGTIVRDEWLRTAALRPGIVIDEFVVMPNHFHAIIALIYDFLRGRGAPRPYDRDWIAYRLFQAAHPLTTAEHRVITDRTGGARPALSPTAQQRLPTADQCPALSPLAEIDAYLEGRSAPPSDRDRNATLSDVVGAFKSAATKRINAMHGIRGARRWQRSFHDHAIRDALELDLFRQYIKNNPRRWAGRQRTNVK